MVKRAHPGPTLRRRARAWSQMLSRALGVLVPVVVVAYPLVVYFCFTRLSPGRSALVLLIVVVPLVAGGLRRAGPGRLRILGFLPIVTAVLLMLTAALNSHGWALAAPVAINAILLVAFGSTLFSRASMIERFARLQEPDLMPEKVLWCRRWTVVWCAFFVLNALVSGLLAWSGELRWWALYTGLIAYVLIGILLLTEWFARRLRFGSAARSDSSGVR